LKTSAGLACFVLVFAGVALMYLPGDKAVSAPASNAPRAKANSLINTSSITLAQRSRRALDTQHTLYLHISDITRGQVMTWISDDRQTIFGPISMYGGQVESVQLNGQRMQLRLRYLENHLIGNDYAHFELEAAEPPSQDQIEVQDPDRIET
jgi:hypothetical protein